MGEVPLPNPRRLVIEGIVLGHLVSSKGLEVDKAKVEVIQDLALPKSIMDIMWRASQSHVHLLFIFIEMNFYSLSFLSDVCNEVHEHMQ